MRAIAYHGPMMLRVAGALVVAWLLVGCNNNGVCIYHRTETDSDVCVKSDRWGCEGDPHHGTWRPMPSGYLSDDDAVAGQCRLLGYKTPLDVGFGK
jgi:hypothetical protein